MREGGIMQTPNDLILINVTRFCFFSIGGGIVLFCGADVLQGDGVDGEGLGCCSPLPCVSKRVFDGLIFIFSGAFV